MNVGFQRKKDQRGPLLSYVCHRITEIEEDFSIILYFISLRFLYIFMVIAYIGWNTYLSSDPVCHKDLKMFIWGIPRLVGRYCSYLLPKQALTTFSTNRKKHCDRLDK